MKQATHVHTLVACTSLVILLAVCGGRVPLPSTTAQGTTRSASSASTSSTSISTSSVSSLPTLPSGATPPPTPVVPPDQAATSGDPTKQAILTAYETYLFDLSGLDDTLSKAYIPPLAAVTTERLAEASVRQAAALLNAHEHGTGILRDDRITIQVPSSTSADVTDCQDEYDFYPVEDTSGAADSFVQRGYFAGAAQLVYEGGQWLVDIFTTTHITCSY